MRFSLALIGVAMVVVAAAIVFTFKIVWDDYVYNQRLISVEVTAPDGWNVVPYLSEHGETVVAEAFAPRDAPATTTQRLLRHYADISEDVTAGAVWTFMREDERIVLSLVFGPHQPPKRDNIFSQMKLATAAPPKPNLDVEVATVAGAPLILKPRTSSVPGNPFPEPVSYRRFTMRLGDEEVDEVLDIKVLTNSTDAAVAAAIIGVDLERANQLLPAPDPNVSVSLGIVSDAPLATSVPEPTIAYRAAEMLENGHDYGAPWTEALQRVKSGEIMDWTTLNAEYPDQIHDAPFELLTVLDNGTEENTARYFASAMIDSGRDWNDHEYYILTKVADIATAQSDLAQYLSGDYEVAPEVLALIAGLPETRAIEPTSTADVNARPSVSSGFGQSSRCRIENGVRRCSVGGN
ncbi:hypothetical protein CLV80_10281 [Yoonia maritima]|uniref:Uncharacterized protein n=1 Tax=Yoonia maritima TaxID=1435347 RepID=A0A2T0W2Q6_9RHOB|nr:hypothetical protein [Yoonia maritima]PRY79438.1 hypothetical protein CLV80_10281 [Yoonia maritima]